jgi:hypothetical protein
MTSKRLPLILVNNRCAAPYSSVRQLVHTLSPLRPYARMLRPKQAVPDIEAARELRQRYRQSRR